MKLLDIREVLEAEVLTGEEFLDKEVNSAFGCDLMSDVLAFVNEDTVLLTGLNNPQVIRTAEMMDVFAIIFVRGKMPNKDILDLANKKNITIMTTNHILYTSCGLLYEKGLRGIQYDK